jgi:N-acetylneuraminate synthase
MSVFFIAEAGVNHNGDKEVAYRLIDAAVAAGADAVKFQTFSASALASENAPKAAYQKNTTDAAESQLDMLKRLELPYDWHFKLRDYCQSHGIEFLSTPFDSQSLRFLVDDLKLTTIKSPSGEVTNGPFLHEIAASGLKIILSTGMSTLEEVRRALSVLAHGLIGATGKISFNAFDAAMTSKAGQAALKQNVTILHCTSAYPTPLQDANVMAMTTLRDTFGLNVGFSDHTEGETAALTAAALGATAIEKHFTLDRSLPGPDHKASLEPDELTSLINKVRAVETCLGDGIKKPRPAEIGTIPVARKSLVASSEIKKGEKFGPQNITAKRPGDGKTPMLFWDIIDEAAPNNIDEGEKI